MIVLMCGETIPSETLYGGGGGLNKWRLNVYVRVSALSS